MAALLTIIALIQIFSQALQSRDFHTQLACSAQHGVVVHAGIVQAAGETLGALGISTPQTIGFLFMAIAVLILSLASLRGQQFK